MKARSRKKRALGAVRVHPMITMSIPNKEGAYPVAPFTGQVIAMLADPDRALVWRRQGETIARIAGACGAAIRAARRRDPDKQFVMRRISHNGSETYGVWRIK